MSRFTKLRYLPVAGCGLIASALAGVTLAQTSPPATPARPAPAPAVAEPAPIIDRGPRDPATPRPIRDAVRDAARESGRELRDASREGGRALREGATRLGNATEEAVLDARDAIRGENLRSADIGVWFKRDTANGLIVADIGTGEFAKSIGLKEGDRIVSVSGHPVNREVDFMRALYIKQAQAQPLQVVVMRAGQEATVELHPAQLLAAYQRTSYDPMENFGVVLDDRYPDRVVIWRVLPRTPAYYAGFRPRDIITTFHGRPVTSTADLTVLVEKAEPGWLDVEVTRNQQTRKLEVEMAQQPAVGERTTFRRDLDINNQRRIERQDERRDGLQDLRENRDPVERREDRRDTRQDIREELREPAPKADVRDRVNPQPVDAPGKATAPVPQPGGAIGRK
ncbi:MAG: PDZ domain-containing protein [Planctomycetota bacterium]|nr:PDZ domain-containing protein [Planctomycetota bacterium]